MYLKVCNLSTLAFMCTETANFKVELVCYCNVIAILCTRKLMCQKWDSNPRPQLWTRMLHNWKESRLLSLAP